MPFNPDVYEFLPYLRQSFHNVITEKMTILEFAENLQKIYAAEIANIQITRPTVNVTKKEKLAAPATKEEEKQIINALFREKKIHLIDLLMINFLIYKLKRKFQQSESDVVSTLQIIGGTSKTDSLHGDYSLLVLVFKEQMNSDRSLAFCTKMKDMECILNVFAGYFREEEIDDEQVYRYIASQQVVRDSLPKYAEGDKSEVYITMMEAIKERWPEPDSAKLLEEANKALSPGQFESLKKIQTEYLEYAEKKSKKLGFCKDGAGFLYDFKNALVSDLDDNTNNLKTGCKSLNYEFEKAFYAKAVWIAIADFLWKTKQGQKINNSHITEVNKALDAAQTRLTAIKKIQTTQEKNSFFPKAGSSRLFDTEERTALSSFFSCFASFRTASMATIPSIKALLSKPFQSSTLQKTP